MGERWKMNRIGFVNFWLYDDEIFEFENGKLLLRGQNGSGKSITTQSFIPFILDGDRTPSRLDPFGSSDRRMEYYFLGEEGREEATGYLFLEFYKADTQMYRTIGIGQRARRGKPMDFWGFVLLDQRRIGVDLQLYREVGSNRIPLAKNDLKKLLGEETPFTEVPRDYKALVNKHIFGFRKMEQYEQFIRLLVKVRAPKLSKEFKPTKVYDILNESLQTLTDEDLRAMVDAMEKMDGIQENLDQLNRAYGDLRIIRTEYTRYNQYMLAKKGEAYLAARQEAETARKELRDQEAARDQMQMEQQEKTLRGEEIGSRLKVVGTELDSLYDTDMEEADRKLSAARRNRQEAQDQLQKWENRINDCKQQIQTRAFRIRELDGHLELERDRLSGEREALTEEQKTLQWTEHEALTRLISLEQADGTDALSSRLKDYKKQIGAGRQAVDRFETVQKEYDGLAEQLEQQRREREILAAREEAAQTALADAQDELIQAFFDLRERNQEWQPSERVLRTIEQQLKKYAKPADGDDIRQLLNRDFEEKRQQRIGEKLEWERTLRERREQLALAEAELAAVRDQAELEPERDEMAVASRKALQEAGIRAVPFFKAVEFAPEVTMEEGALIEAQLLKMGILDALVVSDADACKIRETCPWFLDTIVRVEAGEDAVRCEDAATCGDVVPAGQEKGDFLKLTVSDDLDEGLCHTVEAILRYMRQDTGAVKAGAPGPQVVLGADGHFRQGVLEGRTAGTGEAAYVGRLARQRRREQRLRMLEAKVEELRLDVSETEEELQILADRLEQLQREYQNSPELKLLNEALEQLRICAWHLEQAAKRCEQQEKLTEACLGRRNQAYQQMLQTCRQLPYGRTAAAYQEAWEAAEEYQQIWQRIREVLMKIERCLSDIRREEDMREAAEAQMDEAFVEQRRCRTACDQQDILIRKYEDYLSRPEVKEQAARIARLKSEQTALSREGQEIDKRMAVLADRIRRILEQEEPKQRQLREAIARETVLARYFEEELELGLILDRKSGTLQACAVRAQTYLRDLDKGREAGDMFRSLFQVFQKHNGSLTAYGTALENCFEGDEGHAEQAESAQAEHMTGGEAETLTRPAQALRSRVRLVSVWNGRRLYLEEFFQILKNTIDETELLIQKKDRELFEDILSQTISRQLTDRIADSRRWTRDMSALMKELDTSMGLTFSLEWKPRSAENDAELDTQELEQILLRDRELLTVEDISRVAAHFRSKIRSEKQRQEELGGVINYMDMVRDALDYRKWFEFQMYYRRGEESRRVLTNAAFNRFSGGEKAMAMYVPLFAAVNAQYQKADLPDHPRIIALDEAFAGVDDKNISSMFALVDTLDFDYIMNSQALWGCYGSVRELKIVELCRPLNSQIVTPIRYTWNGHERLLDEQ